MALTLLGIVQAAQAELGLFPVTTAVTSSTDDTVQQLFYLANRLGQRTMQRRDWTALQTEAVLNVAAPTTTTGNTTAFSATITNLPSTSGIVAGTFAVSGGGIPTAARVLSVDSATQLTMTEQATSTATGTSLTISQDTYALPSDFRHAINRTDWDRTNHWELVGPISPQEWQWLISGIVTTGPRRRYRIIGANMRLFPAPSSADSPATLCYEYISSNWVTGGKSSFSADTDTCIFPDDVMVTGLKLLVWQIKGFDFSALQVEHERAIEAAMSQDGAAKTLSMDRRGLNIFMTPGNVQDANYPGAGYPNG